MEKEYSNRISQLAATISENTAIYNRYLQLNNISSPSFDKDVKPVSKLPEDVQNAQDAIYEASVEMQALIGGPHIHIRNQTMPHSNLISLTAIYRFGIAKSFPIEDEVSYQEISEKCGLNEVDLRRILRHAMTKYIFHETSEGKVGHTAASKLLAEMPMFNDFVGMVCEEMWPAASRTVDALVRWPGSQESIHTGFAISNNIEDTLFSELNKDPIRAKRFNNAMDLMNFEKGFEPIHVLDAFKWWDSVHTFIDIGGGARGDVSLALAERFPKLHCINQDLPSVVRRASSMSFPNGLSERVTFMEHDFFSDQPVKGADVYFFRWVLHNHSDKYCIEIIRHLIPALKQGARIVVAEFIVPPPGMLPKYKEWSIRTMDFCMLELFNSKERDAGEWKELFRKADENFGFVGIQRPKNSKLGFIEFLWNGLG